MKMRIVLGLLYIFLGLAVTIGGGYVGFLLVGHLQGVIVGGAAVFFCAGIWLLALGASSLEKAQEE